MNAPNVSIGHFPAPAAIRPSRSRLVRDEDARARFSLREGEAYRIAYVAGGSHLRRVSRSVVLFAGVAERRRWDGEAAKCLEFVLPQGRPLSLLDAQLVDVRSAELNERGQWVLQAQGVLARRARPVRRAPTA